MKLGAYTACLHDKPVAEAVRILSDLGLDSAEINSGGFLPAPHLPIDRFVPARTRETSTSGCLRRRG
jgi:sugar phosphate isomerase/epimerase